MERKRCVNTLVYEKVDIQEVVTQRWLDDALALRTLGHPSDVVELVFGGHWCEVKPCYEIR